MASSSATRPDLLPWHSFPCMSGLRGQEEQRHFHVKKIGGSSSSSPAFH